MAKFMSRTPRLNVVLRPSVPSDPTSGRPGMPGIYVLFENYEVNIENPETVEMLRGHSGFGQDFVEIADSDMLELARRQQSMDVPAQQITEFKYGHVEQTTGRPSVKVTPEMKKAIVELAAAAAQQMFEKLNSAADKKVQPQEEDQEVITSEDVEEPKVAAKGRGKKT